MSPSQSQDGTGKSNMRSQIEHFTAVLAKDEAQQEFDARAVYEVSALRVWYFWLPVYLSVCLSIYLSVTVYLSIYLRKSFDWMTHS